MTVSKMRVPGQKATGGPTPLPPSLFRVKKVFNSDNFSIVFEARNVHCTRNQKLK